MRVAYWAHALTQASFKRAEKRKEKIFPESLFLNPPKRIARVGEIWRQGCVWDWVYWWNW